MSTFQFVLEEEFVRLLSNEVRTGKEIIPLLGAGLSAASGIPPIPVVSTYLNKCIFLAMQQQWVPQDGWPDLHFFNRLEFDKPESSKNLDVKQIDIELLSSNNQYCRGFGATSDWRLSLDFISRLRPAQDGGEGFGYPDPSIIDSFFRHLTFGKKPNLAHRTLASMARLGITRLLLTINFDELIEAAFESHPELRLIPISLHHNTELPPYSTLMVPNGEITLLKLHGGRYGLRADDTLDLEPTANELENFSAYFRLPKKFYHAPGGNVTQDSTSGVLLIAGLSMADQRLANFVEHLNKDVPNVKIFWVCYSDRDVEIAKDFCQKRDIQPYTNDDQPGPRVHIHQCRDIGLLLYHFYQYHNKSIPPTHNILADCIDVPFPANPRVRISDDQNEIYANERIFDYSRQVELASTVITDVEEPDREVNPTQADEVDDGSFSIEKFRQEKARINQYLDDFSSSKAASFLAIFGTDQFQGISTLASAVHYDRIEKRETVLWIDADNAGSMDDLFEQIIEGIKARIPTRLWSPSRIFWNREHRAQLMTQYLKLLANRWCIIINAREGAGTNGPNVRWEGIPEDHLPSRETGKATLYVRGSYKDENNLADVRDPNGWLGQPDLVPRMGYISDTTQAFIAFVREFLERGEKANCSVVLVAHKHMAKRKTAGSISDRESHLFRSLNPDNPKSAIANQLKQFPAETITIEAEHKMSAISDKMMLKTIRKWLTGESDEEKFTRFRFLYGLLLMDFPRHRASVYSYALRFTESELKYIKKYLNLEIPPRVDDQIDDYLQEILNSGLARMKPGGFLWMHSGTRDRLKRLLEFECTDIDAKLMAILRVHHKYDCGICDVHKQASVKEIVDNSNIARASVYRFFDKWFNSGKAGGYKAYEQICRDTGRLNNAMALLADQKLKYHEYKRDLPAMQSEEWPVIRKMVKASASKALASWYCRLLQSDAGAFAAIKSLHHFIKASQAFYDLFDTDDVDLKNSATVSAVDSLLDAQQLLRAHRDSIVNDDVASSKCRRLDSITFQLDRYLIRIARGKYDPKSADAENYRMLAIAIFRLKEMVLKTLSIIARETGFIHRSFVRALQIRKNQRLFAKLFESMDGENSVDQVSWEKELVGLFAFRFQQEIEEEQSEEEQSEEEQS